MMIFVYHLEDLRVPQVGNPWIRRWHALYCCPQKAK